MIQLTRRKDYGKRGKGGSFTARPAPGLVLRLAIQLADGDLDLVGVLHDELIIDALYQTDGRQDKAAALIGMTCRSMSYHLKRLGLRQKDGLEWTSRGVIGPIPEG